MSKATANVTPSGERQDIEPPFYYKRGAGVRPSAGIFDGQFIGNGAGRCVTLMPLALQTGLVGIDAVSVAVYLRLSAMLGPKPTRKRGMPKSYRDLAGDGGSNIVGQVSAQLARLHARMQGIRGRVAVVSGKGGVGKSAITVNLATAVAIEGAAVGILDADLNGPCIAKMTGVRGERLVITAEGVQPAQGPVGMRIMSMDLLLPHDDTPVTWQATTQTDAHVWRGSMEATALREFLSDTVWGKLDFLFLDLPPGTDRIATVADILPGLTGMILVTIPSEVSHLVVRKSLALARDLKVPVLGLIENMAGYQCQNCQTVGELFRPSAGHQLARDFGIRFLGELPFDPRLARSGDSGIPFMAVHQETATGRAFRMIARGLTAAMSDAAEGHTERGMR
jgi:ATP-binding protein involved in chromosome partitioning